MCFEVIGVICIVQTISCSYYLTSGSDSEGSDHEMRQWEEQQIKKGVSIPQVGPNHINTMPQFWACMTHSDVH